MRHIKIKLETARLEHLLDAEPFLLPEVLFLVCRHLDSLPFVFRGRSRKRPAFSFYLFSASCLATLDLLQHGLEESHGVVPSFSYKYLAYATLPWIV